MTATSATILCRALAMEIAQEFSSYKGWNKLIEKITQVSLILKKVDSTFVRFGTTEKQYAPIHSQNRH